MLPNPRENFKLGKAHDVCRLHEAPFYPANGHQSTARKKRNDILIYI